MSKNVILIRHAESLEDVDPTMHNISNGKIAELTEDGKTQAHRLGFYFQKKIQQSQKIYVYLSPARRAQETWNIVSTYINSPMELFIERRIRNLNWGNIRLDNRAEVEAERYKVGVLNFTFPQGDHTPSYVSSINNLMREALRNFKNPDYDINTLLFITHGFALRVIVKYLLLISEKDFQWLKNPPNCYFLELLYDPVTDSFSSAEPLLRMDPI